MKKMTLDDFAQQVWDRSQSAESVALANRTITNLLVGIVARSGLIDNEALANLIRSTSTLSFQWVGVEKHGYQAHEQSMTYRALWKLSSALSSIICRAEPDMGAVAMSEPLQPRP